ncbi:MAG: triose-phosphate isomerase [Actinomycetota bacterium]|nr:triose-phosphate isomerase [Actinomycetota bacterium]
MTRRPLISGNWKMNHHHYDAIAFVEKFRVLVPDDAYEHVDVSVHPPFTDLRSVQTLIDADTLKFSLGAQNCHWEDAGAFTGEVSTVFLAKLRVSYVICGHSERRELFGETDETVARKLAAVRRHGMTPIVCVGETLDERERQETESKVVGQVRAALAGRSAGEVASTVIAYEPIWAIGTGRTATAGDAQDVCAAIRRTVADGFGADAADAVRIQYGGSVKSSNINELTAQPDIDGVLVGGASLDPEEFARIVQFSVV